MSIKTTKTKLVTLLTAAGSMLAISATAEPAAAKKLRGEDVAAIAILGAAAVVALSTRPRCFEKTRCFVNMFGDEICKTRRVCR